MATSDFLVQLSGIHCPALQSLQGLFWVAAALAKSRAFAPLGFSCSWLLFFRYPPGFDSVSRSFLTVGEPPFNGRFSCCSNCERQRY